MYAIQHTQYSFDSLVNDNIIHIFVVLFFSVFLLLFLTFELSNINMTALHFKFYSIL